MDSVWSEVDESIFPDNVFFKVQTNAKTKEMYIKRPDLGRTFSETELKKLTNTVFITRMYKF